MATIARSILRAGTASPHKLALTAPAEALSWSSEQLATKVQALSGALRELGYKRGDVVVHDLPNTHHNFLLQAACSHLGAAVATTKDAAGLAKLLGGGMAIRGAFAVGPGSFLASAEGLALPTVAGNGAGVGAIALEDVLAAPARPADPEGSPDLPAAWFNPKDATAKPLTSGDLMALGENTSHQLGLSAEDAGIGTGCAGALKGGSAIVLPSAGGIRGCGDPGQRAEVTRDALVSAQCTVLVGDSHTIKALEPLGAPAGLALRTGVIKVASGTDFLTATVGYAGLELRTMGKQA